MAKREFRTFSMGTVAYAPPIKKIPAPKSSASAPPSKDYPLNGVIGPPPPVMPATTHVSKPAPAAPTMDDLKKEIANTPARRK